VPIDEVADIGFELPDRGMNTSLELLPSELSEPALSANDAVRLRLTDFHPQCACWSATRTIRR
jgi:hypothetical protein